MAKSSNKSTKNLVSCVPNLDDLAAPSNAINTIITQSPPLKPKKSFWRSFANFFRIRRKNKNSSTTGVAQQPVTQGVSSLQDEQRECSTDNDMEQRIAEVKKSLKVFSANPTPVKQNKIGEILELLQADETSSQAGSEDALEFRVRLLNEMNKQRQDVLNVVDEQLPYRTDASATPNVDNSSLDVNQSELDVNQSELDVNQSEDLDEEMSFGDESNDSDDEDLDVVIENGGGDDGTLHLNQFVNTVSLLNQIPDDESDDSGVQALILSTIPEESEDEVLQNYSPTAPEYSPSISDFPQVPGAQNIGILKCEATSQPERPYSVSFSQETQVFEPREDQDLNSEEGKSDTVLEEKQPEIVASSCVLQNLPATVTTDTTLSTAETSEENLNSEIKSQKLVEYPKFIQYLKDGGQKLNQTGASTQSGQETQRVHMEQNGMEDYESLNLRLRKNISQIEIEISQQILNPSVNEPKDEVYEMNFDDWCNFKENECTLTISESEESIRYRDIKTSGRNIEKKKRHLCLLTHMKRFQENMNKFNDFVEKSSMSESCAVENFYNDVRNVKSAMTFVEYESYLRRNSLKPDQILIDSCQQPIDYKIDLEKKCDDLIVITVLKNLINKYRHERNIDFDLLETVILKCESELINNGYGSDEKVMQCLKKCAGEIYNEICPVKKMSYNEINDLFILRKIHGDFECRRKSNEEMFKEIDRDLRYMIEDLLTDTKEIKEMCLEPHESVSERTIEIREYLNSTLHFPEEIVRVILENLFDNVFSTITMKEGTQKLDLHAQLEKCSYEIELGKNSQANSKTFTSNISSCASQSSRNPSDMNFLRNSSSNLSFLIDPMNVPLPEDKLSDFYPELAEEISKENIFRGCGTEEFNSFASTMSLYKPRVFENADIDLSKLDCELVRSKRTEVDSQNVQVTCSKFDVLNTNPVSTCDENVVKKKVSSLDSKLSLEGSYHSAENILKRKRSSESLLETYASCIDLNDMVVRNIGVSSSTLLTGKVCSSDDQMRIFNFGTTPSKIFMSDLEKKAKVNFGLNSDDSIE